MSYFKKRLWIIILFYLFCVLVFVVGLRIKGPGYRPGVLGGTGPIIWKEIFLFYKLKILIGSSVLTGIGIYFDYWEFKKKNEKQDKA